MITTLKVNEPDYIIYEDETQIDYLKNLKKINIFVGSNNSGKSRLMRKIISLKEYNYQIGLEMQKINSKVNQLKTNIEGYFRPHRSVQDYIKPFLDQLGSYDYLGTSSKLFDSLTGLKKQLESMSSQTNTSWGGLPFPKIANDCLSIYTSWESTLEFSLDSLKPLKFTKIYVPILRGLRPIPANCVNSDETDEYRKRTIGDYFSRDLSKFEKDSNFQIFTGNTLYDEIKRLLLGSHEQRSIVREYEEYLSHNFFDNKQVTLTPNISSDVLFIKIGDDERAIYDLGDGIQSIIIATFPLFKYKKDNLLLFVEEPEQCLHPEMQRKLMEIYTKESSKSQIFITTHSNHMLDLSLDYDNASIFTFNKDNNFNKFIVKNITRNKEILELLGVKNSSVFLSNCIIWVEGISDRLLIRKFIELYNVSKKEEEAHKTFQEDIHYSFIEYGGENITHFNFDKPQNDDISINVDAISKNNFLIVDNDGINYETSESQNPTETEIRTRKLKRLFKTNFFAKHREIENIITPEIFKLYFENKYKGRKYKLRDDLDLPSMPNINDFAIGEFLRMHFIQPNTTLDESKEPKDITVIESQKINFAKKIIELIDEQKISFESLSDITKEMIINIYSFIKSNNS